MLAIQRKELEHHVSIYFATWFNNLKIAHNLKKVQDWMTMMEDTPRRENEGTEAHAEGKKPPNNRRTNKRMLKDPTALKFS